MIEKNGILRGSSPLICSDQTIYNYLNDIKYPRYIQESKYFRTKVYLIEY